MKRILLIITVLSFTQIKPAERKESALTVALRVEDKIKGIQEWMRANEKTLADTNCFVDLTKLQEKYDYVLNFYNTFENKETSQAQKIKNIVLNLRKIINEKRASRNQEALNNLQNKIDIYNNTGHFSMTNDQIDETVIWLKKMKKNDLARQLEGIKVKININIQSSPCSDKNNFRTQYLKNVGVISQFE